MTSTQMAIALWLVTVVVAWTWVYRFPHLRPKEPTHKGTVVTIGCTVVASDGREYKPTGTFVYNNEDPDTHPYLEEIK